jgi:hypothetical protein
MIVWASGLQMGAGRFSRPQRAVGMVTMPDAGLDTPRRIQVRPGAGVLRLLVPGVGVGVFIDRRCVVDGVDVTR